MVDDIAEISPSDNHFPSQLNTSPWPPEKLYVRGNVDLLKTSPMLAVVGSRKASLYGRQAVTSLLTPLVQTGIPLVSGLAYGIDAAAHRLCVDQNVPTIAVLGSGIDDNSIYPKMHIKLAHQIIDHGGAIISEYEPSSRPYLGYFPARNRIIAALSTTTLIVQAAVRSGSLITARLALEAGRDVAAVPGNINDPLAAGTNDLIRQGATPAISPQDIFDLLGVPAPKAKPTPTIKLTDDQKQVIAQLSGTPRHLDELAQQTKLPAATLSVTLVELELTGVVTNVGGMKYTTEIEV